MVCSRRSLGQLEGSERLGVSDRKALEDVVKSFENVGKLRSKLADAQSKAMNRLLEWSRTGENVAIEDVCTKMKELAVMHGDELKQLAKRETKCAEELRKMNNYECQIATTRRKVADLREKEHKMIKKTNARNEPLRSDLTKTMELIKMRELEEARLEDLLKEAEVAKMIFFRTAMKGHGDAYCAYSQNTGNIFACQREITELVPAVAREDVMMMKYEGKPITRQKVDSVRRSIDAVPVPPVSQTSVLLGPPKHRRRSEPLRMGARFENRPVDRVQRSPPPPYSPGGALSFGYN